MASIVTPQTLKVDITETITLNGVTRNGKASVSIPTIGQIISGVMQAPAHDATPDTAILASFGDATAAETATVILSAGVKYVRITNKDDTNDLNVRLGEGANSNDNAILRVNPKESLVLSDIVIDADVHTNTALAADAPTFTTMTYIEVSGQGGNVDVEYYIAAT